jgi:hypothetical protein
MFAAGSAANGVPLKDAGERKRAPIKDALTEQGVQTSVGASLVGVHTPIQSMIAGIWESLPERFPEMEREGTHKGCPHVAGGWESGSVGAARSLWDHCFAPV